MCFHLISLFRFFHVFVDFRSLLGPDYKKKQDDVEAEVKFVSKDDDSEETEDEDQEAEPKKKKPKLKTK